MEDKNADTTSNTYNILLENVIDNNNLRMQKLDDIKQKAAKFKEIIQDSMQPLLELYQILLSQRVNLLMNNMNNEYKQYINTINNTKQIWQTENDNLSQIEQSKSTININDQVSKIKENTASLLSKQSDEMNNYIDNVIKPDDEDQYKQYFGYHILLKRFLQNILGLQLAMQIHILESVSIHYLSFWRNKPEGDDGDEQNEQETDIESSVEHETLYILSHGLHFMQQIEKDLKSFDIEIDEKEEIESDDISWTVNWGNDFEAPFDEEPLKSMIESICPDDVLHDIIDDISEKTILKENDKVIKWELSVTKKPEYNDIDYIKYIVGPFFVGNMIIKYNPNALNAKYLKIYESIPSLYIRMLCKLMDNNNDNTQIVPNAIVELIKKFHNTTSDQYPFGCLVLL